MREIELTRGQVAKVDDKWYDYLNQWKWMAKWSEHTQSFYAVRNDKRPQQIRLYMHRIVANTPDDMLCDHRNHDTLDNQEENLRNATNSQNMMNRKVQRNNALKEKGISVNGIGFQVRVYKEKVCVYRKTFRNLDDAKFARDEAYRLHHEEFSYLANQK